tara:strand:+ start:490 stop:1002 length:513 start_codon:yes stop_codon:yes gene_type:complete
MASRSKSDKYWLANNPNAVINDAKAVKLAELSATSVSLAELNALDAGAAVGDAVSCTITNDATGDAGAAKEFSVQFKDSAGANVSKAITFDYYLSSDAAGQTLASAATEIADGGAGALLHEYTADLSGKFITTAAGLAEVDVTATGVALYFNVIMPDGSVTTSSVLTWAS